MCVVGKERRTLQQHRVEEKGMGQEAWEVWVECRTVPPCTRPTRPRFTRESRHVRTYTLHRWIDLDRGLVLG